jgi:hypothetical protein
VVDEVGAEVRFDATRLDHKDPDAEVPDLDVQRFAQGLERLPRRVTRAVLSICLPNLHQGSCSRLANEVSRRE